jgi:hypothetical protein
LSREAYGKTVTTRASMVNSGMNGSTFYTLRETQVLIEEWRLECNTFRPHSSLKYRPPAPEAWLHWEPSKWQNSNSECGTCIGGRSLKNYGLAAGLALSLFSKESALPAAVFMIFMMTYIAWLDFKLRLP